MPTIGESLREARMRQQLDIVDVERRTKIRAKYLRALENEEFGMLPGPTFVKTFLRTYAELLGLDPHALVEQYRAGYEPHDELETLKPVPQGPGGRNRRRGGGGGPGPWMVVALLAASVLIGLVVLGLLAEGGDDSGDGTASRTETTRTERREPQRERERPAPTRVVLRITPVDPTYVCVDRGLGTEVVFEATLDTARTFRGTRLRVNLGKRSVAMRVNGRPVPIEPGPDPVGFEFTPGSTEEVPIGERRCA
jgi:cytoskeletal protein RodZ